MGEMFVLVKELATPVSIMNVLEYGIDLNAMRNKLKEGLNDYQADFYLVQKNKIDIIQSDLSTEDLTVISNDTWIKIYKNEIKDEDLINIFPSLSKVALTKISSVEPTRFRLISECELTWSINGWEVKRVPCSPFEQSEATISSDDLDYRLIPRTFKELPDYLFDGDLKEILIQVGNKVKEHNSLVTKLSISIHHTLVKCIPNQVSSNSPEGIHQDGMDYIVSALVVDRNNIVGGKSVIYGSDASTPLVNITLQPGQGIFQPDKGTDLWHEVTPISLVNPQESGYRSTIGFDVQVLG